MSRRAAVIDIGKTNAKLALVDLSDLSEIAVTTRPNTVLQGPPWPHFDVEGIWDFLLKGLAQFHEEHGVDVVTVTTHGACAALLAADGTLAAPILDYEHTGPDDMAEAYDALRPPFAETGSPRLAMGLNIGAQLFWQFETDPGLHKRTAQIVTYPQYWGARLTGVTATDVTSLGCHTDLWNPHEGRFSSLVDRLGIARKIAPPRRPDEILGPILPEIAARTGLPSHTSVHCGIHDSNASLLPHVLAHQPPFSVVSTGTWVIAMAMGGHPVTLDPALDTLINFNALGAPVPSARFMGGREHDLALGGPAPEPSTSDLAEVLASGVMLLPAVVPETGPFQGRTATWQGGEPAPGTPQRAAAVGLYLALVTARCLENIGHAGPVIVEGPFARNLAFLQMLGAVTGAPVRTSASVTGTSQGAALLACAGEGPVSETRPIEIDADLVPLLRSYAQAWTSAVAV